MNTFNISFLRMEISLLGSFFTFAHHLVELGSFLASDSIKEFQPAAEADKKKRREIRMPDGIKMVITDNYTTYICLIASSPSV